jgi:nucleotide-binding universal stress UspA family protein
MYRYKRILVNLNMDKNDANIIEQASVIAGMAKSEKIYFLYSERKIDVPEELAKEYPELTESAADFAREKISELIDAIFTASTKPEFTIIIQEGQLLDEILKQVRINGIDLVIYGLAKDDARSKNMATKLARKAACSVLVIPESSVLSLNNPAVAVDFSEYSADATDAALAFIKASGQSNLGVIHIYQVPIGFHKTGKSYEEFAEIMEKNAEKNYEEFVNEVKLENVKLNPSFTLNAKPVEAISKFVKDNGITFLSVGARGRGAGAAVMLGSVSERLIENIDVPILAVKKKGTGLNILNAIFN